MNNIIEMKELIKKIKEADKAYFGDDKPIMLQGQRHCPEGASSDTLIKVPTL